MSAEVGRAAPVGIRALVRDDNQPTEGPHDGEATHEEEIREASARPADSGDDIGPSAQR